MITSDQIRAGRALTRMDQSELAAAAEVSIETIKRIERSEGHANAQSGTLYRIQQALELRGVVFVGAGEDQAGGPGVRLAADPRALMRETIRKAATDLATACTESRLVELDAPENMDPSAFAATVSATFSKLFARELRRILKHE
ncbi:hypothetical protein V5F31_06015 [Xanthobacter sp. V7C-4]|uniref:helix-turn-helix domain-containing protein n=1 Tax=Xanthobacter autotrophicus (strain ATCC BAA-1158 / Py2) TaxID=78245 RepID=UPI0037292DE5